MAANIANLVLSQDQWAFSSLTNSGLGDSKSRSRCSATVSNPRNKKRKVQIISSDTLVALWKRKSDWGKYAPMAEILHWNAATGLWTVQPGYHRPTLYTATDAGNAEFRIRSWVDVATLSRPRMPKTVAHDNFSSAQ